MRGTKANVLDLRLREAKAPRLVPPVVSLAGLAGENIDAGVRSAALNLLLGDARAAGIAVLGRHQLRENVGIQLPELFAARAEKGFLPLPPFGVIAGNPVSGRDRKAGVFQALQRIHRMADVDLAAAAAALNGIGSARAEERKRAGLQRKHAVVFQQDDALGGGFKGQHLIGPLPLGDNIRNACFRLHGVHPFP